MSLKPFFPKGGMAGKGFVPFMNLKYNASARQRTQEIRIRQEGNQRDEDFVIPDVPGKSDGRHQELKKHKLFRKRAGTEPSTDYLKSDCRPTRNFYKGMAGDCRECTSGSSGLQLQKRHEGSLTHASKICGILLETISRRNGLFKGRLLRL